MKRLKEHGLTLRQVIEQDVRLYNTSLNIQPGLYLELERGKSNWRCKILGTLLDVTKTERVSSDSAWQYFRITAGCYGFHAPGAWTVDFGGMWGGVTIHHARTMVNVLEHFQHIQATDFETMIAKTLAKIDWLPMIRKITELDKNTVMGYTVMGYVVDPWSIIDQSYREFLASNPSISNHERARLLQVEEWTLEDTEEKAV